MRASVYRHRERERERERERSGKELSDFTGVCKPAWHLSSYPEQRDVHLAQVVCDGGVHRVLSLEVKEQPGHSVHCDIGHHSEGIPAEGGMS